MPMPQGKQLSDANVTSMAEQMAECLMMWEISLTDSYRIARELMHMLKAKPVKEWNNPLEGTGMKADKGVPFANPKANFEFDA